LGFTLINFQINEMSLPYTFTNEIELPDSENNSLEAALWELYRHFKNSESVSELSADDQKISLSFRSLFTMVYPVEFTFTKDPEIHIEYEIKLMKLIQICVALVIFIAFFSSFGITGYLWFSAIFVVVFFALNLFFADNLIQKLVKSSSFFSEQKLQNEGIISEEQKQWIKDATKCPACGEEITDYDLKCPECGIRVRNQAKASPFDVSNYKQKRFKYYYKEKKDKKNEP